jgi:multiple sugar transport system substrate-binding protein
MVTCVLALALLAGCGYGSEGGEGSKTLNWYAYNEPGGSFDEIAKKCTDGSGGKYEVRVVKLPQDADQQRELLVRRLAAEDSDIDLMTMDVIWTAEFAQAGWVREWTGADAEEARKGRIPSLVRTAEYKNKLWAAPFTTNTQLLWFNKDIVKGKPPETWDEMLAQSKKLGEKGTIDVQAARYEGLTVWFNALVASQGGRIVGENGDVQVNQTAARAGAIMKRVATGNSAPDGLNNMKEDQARLDFQSGNSAFQINYPFIYASAGEEAPEFQKKIGFARYPAVEKGRKSAPPIGGFNIGVSKYSSNPELAFEAGKCLASSESQLIANAKGGLPPTTEALFTSKEVEKAYPGFAKLMRESLKDGVPRPTTPAYNDVSLAVQATLHPIGSIVPEQVPPDLRDKLQTVDEGGIF